MAGIMENIGDFGKSLAGIFDNGLNIYGNLQEKLNAIDRIGEDTVQTVAPSVKLDSDNLTAKANAAMNKALMALIAAAILGVILVALIIKRKKG